MIAAQVAKGRTKQEAERLLAERYPTLAQIVGKRTAKAAASRPRDAAEDFWGLVNAQVARGVPTPRAISTVAREHSEAYRRMLDEYNLEHADARR